MFSGIRCQVCGKAFEAPDYLKVYDAFGRSESMYWFNPKISKLTDVVVYFCGPEHSLEWYKGKVKDAEEVAAHDNDPEQSQPSS